MELWKLCKISHNFALGYLTYYFWLYSTAPKKYMCKGEGDFYMYIKEHGATNSHIELLHSLSYIIPN